MSAETTTRGPVHAVGRPCGKPTTAGEETLTDPEESGDVTCPSCRQHVIIERQRAHSDALAAARARTLPPFKVARDGTVTDRAAGHIVGRVWLGPTLGWVGRTVDGPVIRPDLDGRKHAARAVWNAYRAEVDR